MATKVLVALILSVVALFGLHSAWTNYQLKSDSKRRSLDRLVKQAKAEGKNEIKLMPRIPYYASVSGVDEALTSYTTVLIKPQAFHVQLNSESQDIETWYKMKVVDYLSQPNKPVPCLACSLRQNETIPPEVFPTQDNEFVLVKNTGSLVSDGVTVNSSDATFPDFVLNETYFLFLSLDLNTRIGVIELGPAGVAKIGTDGQLTPVNKNEGKLTRMLAEKYGQIDQVKEQLKLRRLPN